MRCDAMWCERTKLSWMWVVAGRGWVLCCAVSVIVVLILDSPRSPSPPKKRDHEGHVRTTVWIVESYHYHYHYHDHSCIVLHCTALHCTALHCTVHCDCYRPGGNKRLVTVWVVVVVLVVVWGNGTFLFHLSESLTDWLNESMNHSLTPYQIFEEEEWRERERERERKEFKEAVSFICIYSVCILYSTSFIATVDR